VSRGSSFGELDRVESMRRDECGGSAGGIRVQTPTDGKQSPVDVEMTSKPPSRESSFRGDDDNNNTDIKSDNNNNSQKVSASDAIKSEPGVERQPPGTATSAPRTGEGGVVEAAAAALIDCKKRVYGCTVPDCGKVYTKSSHLKSHLRSHTGSYYDVISIFAVVDAVSYEL